MRILTAVIIAACFAVMISKGDSTSKIKIQTKGESSLRLGMNEAVSVFSEDGIQVIIGHTDTGTLVHIRHFGKEVLSVDYCVGCTNGRVEVMHDVGAQHITVVDADGVGVPNHRRVMENGKSHAEVFVGGKFIEPRKEGEKWLAEGQAFEYRNGRFEPITTTK